MQNTVKIINTSPFQDQKPGTSGLRRKVKVFQQPRYIENFIQAYMNVCLRQQQHQMDQRINMRDIGAEINVGEIGAVGPRLLVGGDGRYLMRECIAKIVRVAAANKVGRLYIAKEGICSTPAASHTIRSLGLDGGIILTASHNPGGPDADFGIKFNRSNGGPALEDFTNGIFQESRNITSYKICESIEIDFDQIGMQTFDVAFENKRWELNVEIVDTIRPYVQYMKEIFDFELIRYLITSGNFELTVDALHGVMGPYVRAIIVDELGMDVKHARNCDILTDFGGLHPDPNLTYAADLVRVMQQQTTYDCGFAFDGDGDRNMILGRHGFFLNPCDSLAIITANAQCIPYFHKNPVKGVARSMPTSQSVDKVADKLGIECFETPTGWKFFGNLMDSGRISICGEESFGTGSDHIREKDGMWAALAWLSIMAMKKKSLMEIVQNHWKTFGRNFFTRFDYEGCDSESAKAMMDHLTTLCQLGSLKGKSFGTPDRQVYIVSQMDDYEYKDPIDGSHVCNQGIRIFFTNGSRIVFRLSGTGSSDATVRIYIESYEADENKVFTEGLVYLKPLMDVALEISQIECFTGKTHPTVIT